MKWLFSRLRQPSTYAGLGVALSGFNWSAVVEIGSTQWWTAVVTVVVGVVATVAKGRQE